MLKSFRIGTIFGIPLKLDITFLLILPVFAFIIGIQITEVTELLNLTLDANIDVSLVSDGNQPWVLGFVAAIGLFIGVVLHELGHSLVAQRYGYPIESITLWLLGGVASFSELPEAWRQEFNIAVAGPIVSIFIGIISYGLFELTPALADSISASTLDGMLFVFSYLAILNIFLALFNLLPAFPMDGGRVLRALFARNRPFAKATQQAARIGRLFAIGFGLVGLLMFNIILIALAFFIYIAASSEEQHVLLKAAFQDVTVSEIMTPRPDLRTVSPDTNLDELTKRMFKERHTGYPVIDNDQLVGLVTLEDTKTELADDEGVRRVADIMTTDLSTIDSTTPVMDAIQKMQRDRIGRLLVVENGQLVGLISRTDVMTALEIIQQSGPFRPETVNLRAA